MTFRTNYVPMIIRQLAWIWLALTSSLLTWPSPVNGDADFESVRVSLPKDHSGKKGDPTQKFFNEYIFHPHYDGRFADRTLKEDERRPHLVAMIQAYLSTMADLGAETWLMHGTLLGWWWNGKVSLTCSNTTPC